MSLAARLTLTTASLSSLPTYTMSLFLLADGTHADVDKHLARIFWEGVGDKRKHHWVNWPTVCRPKQQGGLGVINTKLFNIALMAKWIWRLFTDNNSQSLWAKLLQAKYQGLDGFLLSNPAYDSQFWHNLHKIVDAFKLGAKFKLGNDNRILFWSDWWTGPSPIKQRSPRLFDMCSSPNLLVAQALTQDGWRISFRRSFSP